MSPTDFEWRMENLRRDAEEQRRRKLYARMMVLSVIVYAVVTLGVLLTDWLDPGTGRFVLGIAWGQLIIAVIILLRFDIKVINERHGRSTEHLDQLKND